MFTPQQGSGAAQARAEAAQVQAARAHADAAQQQLQQQIQQSVQQALQAVDKAGRDGMSAEAKVELKEEIRAAIDAAREAAAEARVQGGGPAIVFSPSSERVFSSHVGGPFNDDIPPQVPEILGIVGVTLVCCVVGLPLARAFARWIDRRGTVAPVNREVTLRLEGIEQAVESVALEVERISEGQRFTTRMLSERTHEPVQDFAGNRERVPVDLAGAPANARRG